MKHSGFENVFHLEGGIINYVNEAKEKKLEIKFHGKNFVFDQRLGERVTEEIISCCHQCGKPADTHVNCVNDACHLLFIQCDECKEKMEGTCSNECYDFIHLPEEEQKRAAVVVLSEGFWETRFNRDPAIVGTEIKLDGSLWTVTGIMPKEFVFEEFRWNGRTVDWDESTFAPIAGVVTKKKQNGSRE